LDISEHTGACPGCGYWLIGAQGFLHKEAFVKFSAEREGLRESSELMAPFGSGCGQMLPLFPNLSRPKALIGAADIVMRGLLPADRLAFTVTLPMFDGMLSLDPQRSFLGKPFLRKFKEARKR
jgi:hypothetical protein